MPLEKLSVDHSHYVAENKLCQPEMKPIKKWQVEDKEVRAVLKNNKAHFIVRQAEGKISIAASNIKGLPQGINLTLLTAFLADTWIRLHPVGKGQYTLDINQRLHGGGNIIRDPSKLWPGSIVPYEIDDKRYVSGSQERQLILDSIAAWNKAETGFQFIPCMGHYDVLVFGQDPKACYSQIGYQSGRQYLFCAGSDINRARIMREIGHAIGFYQEQQRYDRDYYVTVPVDDPAGIYKKLPEANASGIYDFSSIMHCPTKTASNGDEQTVARCAFPGDGARLVGRAEILSSGDIAAARQLCQLQLTILPQLTSASAVSAASAAVSPPPSSSAAASPARSLWISPILTASTVDTDVTSAPISTLSHAFHSTHHVIPGILDLPAEVLTLIGHILPRRSAISYTSVCTQLFNLRFIGSGGGIISGQCWKRVPRLTETLSSTIILPNGREMTERRMISHAAPGITELYLNCEKYLDAQKVNAVALRLKQLVKLTSLKINCTSLSASIIHIFLTAAIESSRVQGAQSLFVDLTLDDVSADIFEQIDLFRFLRTLSIDCSLTSLTSELGQLINLQSLMIRGDRLTSLPTELGQLSNLQSLMIRGDRLTGLPAELGQLINLQSLDINGHNLTSLPAELWQLSNLQSLRIEACFKLTFLPTELGQLINLQSLTIRGDQLTALPAELGKLSNLQILTINVHGLTSLPAELGKLSKLQCLEIIGNRLTSLPSELGQLSNLQNLSIHHADRLIFLPAELWQLSNLQSLNIGGPGLISFFAKLGPLINLQSLKIGTSSLTSLPAELGQLSNLQSLTISGDNLTSLPAELGQLSNLQSLTISEDNLTSLPAELWQLSKLKSLELELRNLTSLPIELVRLSYSLENFRFNRDRRVRGKVV